MVLVHHIWLQAAAQILHADKTTAGTAARHQQDSKRQIVLVHKLAHAGRHRASRQSSRATSSTWTVIVSGNSCCKEQTKRGEVAQTYV
eukprot:1159183-Pelagomonas_calceolata.AAC.36